MAKAKPPADLCEVALSKWAEVSKGAFWGRPIEGHELDLAAEYCRLFARKAKAEEKISEHGELVASPNGFPVQSPWLQVVNKCRADMIKISATLCGSGRATAPLQGKKDKKQAAAEEVAGGNRFAPRQKPRLVVGNG